MKDVTIIVPVNLIDENTQGLFDAALESVAAANGKDTPIIVVGPKDVLDKLKAPEDFTAIRYAENEVEGLPAQVNAAVSVCDTKWFSVLEYDDTYTDIWFRNVDAYITKTPTDTIFIPLTEVYNYGEQLALGFVNQAPWASSFSEKMGYFDKDILLNFSEVNLTGALINREDYLEVGGLKESMKLFYWYEFLLRAAEKNKTIFVVPKVGYHHFLNRPNSFSGDGVKAFSQDEIDWWYSLAQSEYLFKKDRKKTYQER